MLNKQQFILIIGLASALVAFPAWGNLETREVVGAALKDTDTPSDKEAEASLDTETALVEKPSIVPSPHSSNQLDELKQNEISYTAGDLLAQGLTRIRGVETIQTEKGLELILRTVAGSERLVPLILPQGNDLVIDILDATLAFSIRRGIEELNPAPGISKITVNKVDDSSIRVTITGESQTPSAEVLPGRDDLVLSIAPEEATTAEEPVEEIEVIATGQADDEDNYFVPDATTGTRLDISRLETPASIGSITQEFIEDRAPRRAEDLAGYVSGVTAGDLGQGGLFSGFQIRGFDVGTQLYINGLRDNSRSLVRDFANIERLEILKGFSSLLYGLGEPGGVVNYITEKPQATPSYEISAEAGSFNFYRGEIDLTGPLTDNKNLLYRLNLAVQESDSFVDIIEDDRIFVAPSLTYLTSGGGSLTVEGEYYRQDIDFNSGAKFFDDRIVYDRNYTDPRNVNVYDHYRLAAYFDQPISNNWSLNFSGQYFNTQRDLDPLFTAITFEGETLERFYRILIDDFEQYNLRGEVRGDFNIGASEHQLLIGADYNHDRTKFTGEFAFFGGIDVDNPTFDVPIPTDTEDASSDINDSDWGVYIQDFITLGRFRLLTGLRYGQFDSSGSNDEGDFVSPSVGLVYSITDSASVYASFSQSTVPQSGSPLEDGSSLDPRDATQYEVGAKVNLLDDRLSITTALFNLEQTNIAEDDPQNPSFSILVGDVRSRGFELDVNGQVTDNLSLIATYSFLDSEITSSVVPGQEGNRPVNSPQHSVGLYSKYEFTEGSLSGLSFAPGLVYVGEREGDSENSFEIPSYVRFDLGAAYKVNNLTFRLAAENLFDIRYASASDSRANITQGSPFAVTGSVKVDF